MFPDETVTYAELRGGVASYAAVLAETYGVAKGDRVAIASANTLEYALTEWACLFIGAIVVGSTAGGRAPSSRTAWSSPGPRCSSATRPGSRGSTKADADRRLPDGRVE